MGGRELAAGVDDALARLAVVDDELLRAGEFQRRSRRGDGGGCGGQDRESEEASATERHGVVHQQCDLHA
jgi:hypothetical protein